MRNNIETTGQPIFHLIAIMEDAKRGYLSAAEKIKDDVLALLFERFGYQKGRYINDLKQLVCQTGTHSDTDHFTLSLLYRTWRDLKASFKFGQKENIIKACIKGEETALYTYQLALANVQHDYATTIILEQHVNGIKTVLDTIKEYTGATMR